MTRTSARCSLATSTSRRRREGLDASSVRALEADGTQLATAIEAGARTLHQRAATIAATPVLHSAIATDAATLQELSANEHVLVAQPGERLALYHDNAEVVRVPADAPPLAPGLSRTGEGLELAVSAPIATPAGEVAVAYARRPRAATAHPRRSAARPPGCLRRAAGALRGSTPRCA